MASKKTATIEIEVCCSVCGSPLTARMLGLWETNPATDRRHHAATMIVEPCEDCAAAREDELHA